MYERTRKILFPLVVSVTFAKASLASNTSPSFTCTSYFFAPTTLFQVNVPFEYSGFSSAAVVSVRISPNSELPAAASSFAQTEIAYVLFAAKSPAVNVYAFVSVSIVLSPILTIYPFAPSTAFQVSV